MKKSTLSFIISAVLSLPATAIADTTYNSNKSEQMSSLPLVHKFIRYTPSQD